MKLLIAVDMEGITGVVSWEQVKPGSAEWQRFRRLMTDDVNAAIEGAKIAGVDEVLVADGHWRSDNILIEHLDARAVLNYGSPSPFSMVQGVDQGVDIAFFIGYHARSGTPQAILDHTWSNALVANVWLNDRLAGETALNAAVCGHFDVPVLLVSGDQAVASEATGWLPGVQTAIVKKAAGRFAASCLPPSKSQTLIRDSANLAVERFKNGEAPAPLKVKTPVEIKIEFKATEMADRGQILPGIQRLDGRTLLFKSENMPSAYRFFRSAVGLAGS